jgi:hypothetical protein
MLLTYRSCEAIARHIGTHVKGAVATREVRNTNRPWRRKISVSCALGSAFSELIVVTWYENALTSLGFRLPSVLIAARSSRFLSKLAGTTNMFCASVALL